MDTDVSVLSTPQNACSLTDLPTELLVQIIVLHRSSFDILSPVLEDIAQRQVQHEVLHALSQSCSRLRAVCLPFLWERFDLSMVKFQTRLADYKTALVPTIFSYIESVHVSMRGCRTQLQTMFNLVDFLRTLPNLAVLRISWPNFRMIQDLCSAFSEACLPSVTSLYVPVLLHGIFPAFPNITTLVCPAAIIAGSPVLARMKLFPRLTVLGELRMVGSADLISELARDFPQLRTLSITTSIAPDCENVFSLLNAFADLSELCLFHEDSPDYLSLDVLVSRAKDVLLGSRSLDRRVLRIWSNSLSGPQLIYEERF
ncbi:hypothetical protein MVEN_01453500 [Mycena venus]|uniref:F-box domain-containing protein n=1 Tax=Mycena venus TaxID=2733690 RepID=A0A8H7CQZ6_9AGAR|nr:hypothetical protein MVEN_01453500 [Mycena venus]